MSAVDKPQAKDETHIGEYAAKQPLSGTNVVTMVRVKGVTGANYFTSEAQKKAV